MSSKSKKRQHHGYVSNVPCTPKPNEDIRICLNPKPLNKAVKRPHHYAPKMDILPKLHGCKYFSALDQSSGCWNIEVHPDSIHLLTTRHLDKMHTKGFHLGS